MRNQVGRVKFIGSFPKELPDLQLPEVAFAGRSNVGKSSALNTLMRQRKAARVSARPGRTQSVNLFQIGEACCFADLPGYGYARVPDEVAALWKPMIESYLADRESLKLVVLLVDARREPQQMDLDLYDALVSFGLKVLVVMTKKDKLAKHELKPQLAVLRKAFDLSEDQPIPFSSKTGDGFDDVWTRIERACKKGRR